MRRNGTEIMAIGGILAGAAIGAGGTVALVGSPFDDGLRAGLDCGSVYVSGSPLRATWIYTVDRDGEVRKKKCPARRTTVFVRQAPSRTLAVRPTMVTGRVSFQATRRVEVAELARAQAARQVELAELARAQAARQVELAELARSLAKERAVVVHYDRSKARYEKR